MYIKIIATGEIHLSESTMSSSVGWYYKIGDVYYHQSEVMTCAR